MNKILYKTDQNNPQIKEYREAVERGMHNYHVLPQGDQWIVKQAGSSHISQTFKTQSQAAVYAKAISKSEGTAVFIHGLDGRIKERQDYSEDI